MSTLLKQKHPTLRTN